jgi:hypothetical protein
VTVVLPAAVYDELLEVARLPWARRRLGTSAIMLADLRLPTIRRL